MRGMLEVIVDVFDPRKLEGFTGLLQLLELLIPPGMSLVDNTKCLGTSGREVCVWPVADRVATQLAS